MNILKITKADLNADNEYIGGAIGDYFNHADTHVEIEANLGWVKFKAIYVKGYITAKAGSGIEAGCGIKAGSGIEAGEGIKAGWGIEAGCGIEAGWGINCKLSLSFGYKLFAGTATYTNTAIKTVTCGKLEKGTIAYGDLIETGMPEETKQTDATTDAIKLLKANGYTIVKN